MKRTDQDVEREEVIRAFVAIEINDDVRESLTGLQDQLRKADAKVSWAPPRNIHLSLAFLGDIFESVVEPLGRDIDTVVGEFTRFHFEVCGLGSFGSRNKLRVIWAGVPEPPEVMMQIQALIADSVRKQGIPLDKRPFRPHLTLGRVRSSRNLDALTSAMASAKNTRHGAVYVRRLLIMRSKLNPHGAQYSILHESVLKGE